MRVDRLWTTRQDAGSATASESGRRRRELIEAGATGRPAPFAGTGLDAGPLACRRAGLPRWNTISISACHLAEAAAPPVQEIAAYRVAR